MGNGPERCLIRPLIALLLSSPIVQTMAYHGITLILALLCGMLEEVKKYIYYLSHKIWVCLFPRHLSHFLKLPSLVSPPSDRLAPERSLFHEFFEFLTRVGKKPA